MKNLLLALAIFTSCGGDDVEASWPTNTRIEFRKGVPHWRRAICGNGFIEGAETCDDGGTTAQDGCSAACAVETEWTCTGAPSVCRYSLLSSNLDGSNEHYTCGDPANTDGATLLTKVDWLLLDTWTSGGTNRDYWVKDVTSQRHLVWRALTTGRVQTFIAESLTVIDDSWTSANSAFAAATWHCLVTVYDGTQATNATRLRHYLGSSGTELTGGGTFAGTIPASLTSLSTAELRLASSTAGTNFWGPGNLDDQATWVGFAASQTQAAEICALNRPRNLNDLPTVPDPTFWWRHGDGDTFPTMTNFGTGGAVSCTGQNLESADWAAEVP